MQANLIRAFICVCLAAAGAAAAASGLRASDVIGMPVESRDGKTLGRVNDLVIDLERGQVRAMVVDEGAQLHAHSIAALSGAQAGKLVLNVPHGAVRQALGFERDRWPEFSDPYWAMILPKDVHSAAPRLARASELIGGAIDDIVFAPASGAAHAMIETNHGQREKRVPLSELQ